jgi:hypothetical protein
MDPFDIDAKLDLLEYPDDEILKATYTENREQYLPRCPPCNATQRTYTRQLEEAQYR